MHPEMAAFVRRCSRDGRPIDEVERGLWSSLLRLGHTLLASYVEGVGSGDAGDTLICEERELRRLELPHARRYVSVFGELSISRYVYGTRKTQKHEVVPADALLGLPESELSCVLQEWDQSSCIEGSYEQSRRKADAPFGGIRRRQTGPNLVKLGKMGSRLLVGTLNKLDDHRLCPYPAAIVQSGGRLVRPSSAGEAS